MKNNNDKTMEEILRDTKHNKKLKEVFLHHLAKQKSKHRDWSDARAETYPIKETKQGVDSSDTN